MPAGRQPGYRLHALDSPCGEALLHEQGLTPADLRRAALAELERTGGIAVRTIVGINDDGLFGCPQGGLAARSARRSPGAFNPRPLAAGPRTARACPRGQHRQVPEGRHAAPMSLTARPAR